MAAAAILMVKLPDTLYTLVDKQEMLHVVVGGPRSMCAPFGLLIYAADWLPQTTADDLLSRNVLMWLPFNGAVEASLLGLREPK